MLRGLPEQPRPLRHLPRRDVLLIVVASATASVADEVAARLRRDGNTVYVAHSAAGCLRVATSISPDIVVLDAGLPRRLERLLRAHPASASAQILHLEAPRAARILRPLRKTAIGGPHAA